MSLMNKLVEGGVTTWGVLTDGYTIEQHTFYVYKQNQAVTLRGPAFANPDLGMAVVLIDGEDEIVLTEDDGYTIEDSDLDNDAMSEGYLDDPAEFNDSIDHRIVKSITITNATVALIQVKLAYRTFYRTIDVLTRHVSDVLEGFQTFGQDLTGEDAANYVQDEDHYVNLPAGKQIIVPLGGAFYGHDVVVKKPNGDGSYTTLVNGTDYMIAAMDAAKTRITYHTSGVYDVICLVEADGDASYIGNVRIEYRAFGGDVCRADFDALRGVVYSLLLLWRDVDIINMASHIEDEGDPHTMYQLEAAKDQPNGYAGLNAAGQVPQAEVDALPLHNQNYVIVTLDIDDPTDNADRLYAAYEEAKALTPNDNLLSATNRATLFITPGIIDLTNGETNENCGTYGEDNHGFVLDTEFVDIVALGNVTIKGAPHDSSVRGIIEQFADDIKISAVDGYTLTLQRSSTSTDVDDLVYCALDASGSEAEYVNASLRNVTFDHNSSVRCLPEGTYAGRYVNCITTANYAFNGTLSGTFIECTVGNYSFCQIEDALGNGRGTFEKCTVGHYAFTFFDGICHNCVIGNNAFCYDDTPPIELDNETEIVNCTIGSNAFDAVTIDGQLRHCVIGDNVGGSDTHISQNAIVIYNVFLGDVDFEIDTIDAVINYNMVDGRPAIFNTWDPRGKTKTCYTSGAPSVYSMSFTEYIALFRLGTDAADSVTINLFDDTIGPFDGMEVIVVKNKPLTPVILQAHDDDKIVHGAVGGTIQNTTDESYASLHLRYVALDEMWIILGAVGTWVVALEEEA